MCEVFRIYRQINLNNEFGRGGLQDHCGCPFFFCVCFLAEYINIEILYMTAFGSQNRGIDILRFHNYD